MISLGIRQFLLAFLAQVTLCLSLAPVIAAPQPASAEDQHPSRDGATLQAARDAANIRPEEIGESDRNVADAAGPRRSASRKKARLPRPGPPACEQGFENRGAAAGPVGPAVRKGGAAASDGDQSPFAALGLDCMDPLCGAGVSLWPAGLAVGSVFAGGCVLTTGPPSH